MKVGFQSDTYTPTKESVIYDPHGLRFEIEIQIKEVNQPLGIVIWLPHIEALEVMKAIAEACQRMIGSEIEAAEIETAKLNEKWEPPIPSRNDL